MYQAESSVDLQHLAALAAEEVVRALLALPTRTRAAQIGYEGGVTVEKRCQEGVCGCSSKAACTPPAVRRNDVRLRVTAPPPQSNIEDERRRRSGGRQRRDSTGPAFCFHSGPCGGALRERLPWHPRERRPNCQHAVRHSAPRVY